MPALCLGLSLLKLSLIVVSLFLPLLLIRPLDHLKVLAWCESGLPRRESRTVSFVLQHRRTVCVASVVERPNLSPDVERVDEAQRLLVATIRTAGGAYQRRHDTPCSCTVEHLDEFERAVATYGY